MKNTVLIADDDSDLVTLLETMLSKEGFKILTAKDGESALKQVKDNHPDLVVLDVGMPGKNGLDVCKTLKRGERTKDIPIVMLTARSEEIDRVLGLELGADDYITKPFSIRELILRVKKILQRSYDFSKNSDFFEHGVLSVDHLKHEVKVKNISVNLTLTEFKLLASLIRRPGQVKSRETLLDEIWGYKDGVFSRTIDTHIQRLRTKLKEAGGYIETVRGMGYRFND